MLESLVRALRLDEDERAHLFYLAHQHAPPEPLSARESISPSMRRFLDGLENRPAYVLGRRWDVLAWNTAACAVFGDFASLSSRERNMIWRLFATPGYRQLLDDWEGLARRVLGQFRANVGRYLSDPSFAELINELNAISPEFRAWWPDHVVHGSPDGLKIFNHPTRGRLVFEHLTLQLLDAPDLKVVIYSLVEPCG